MSDIPKPPTNNNNKKDDPSNNENNNNVSGGGSGSGDVAFLDTEKAVSGTASPFPGQGFVAPANTPVTGVYGKTPSNIQATNINNNNAISEVSIPKPSVQKPIQVPKEHQSHPSLESVENLLQQAYNNGDANVINVMEKLVNLSMNNTQNGLAGSTELLTKQVKIFEPLQKKYDEIEEQYQKERHELELKYHNLYKPLHEERVKYVNAYDDQATSTSNEKEGEENDDNVISAGFWLDVLTSIKGIRNYIYDTDEEALRYLKDIRMRYLEGGVVGYALDFEFKENPFFHNTILTKSLEVEKLYTSDDNLEFGKVTGTSIEWKSLQNNLSLELKEDDPDADEEDPTSYVPRDSFFDYFKPSKWTESEDNEVELTEEEFFHLQRDYQISESVRQKVIPNAIKWYTGEAYESDDEEEEQEGDGEEEGDGYEDEDEEDEEEDDDDDEDEEDDDDDAQMNAPPMPQFSFTPNVPGNNNTGKGGNNAQNPECKQQ